MIYSEEALPPSTLGHGICLWRFSVEDSDPPSFTHVIPPDGTVNLAAILVPGRAPMLSITGPSPRAHLVPAMHGMAAGGVRLQPGAAPLLLREDARTFVGVLRPYIPANEQEACLAQAMIAFAQDPAAAPALASAFEVLTAAQPPVDPLAAMLAQRLRLHPLETEIGPVIVDTGLGPRQLRRRFVTATGLAPKVFARIQRLRNAVLIALETPAANWAHVAAEAGFADQAHFNRDLAQAFGTTPTSLLSYLGTIRHALVPR